MTTDDLADAPCVDGCGQDAATIARLREKVADLTAERDRAREDCGHQKAMRESIRAEMERFIPYRKRAMEAEAAIERAREALDSVGVLHPVAADHVLRALDGPQEARSADSGTGGPPESENAAQVRIGWDALGEDA